MVPEAPGLEQMSPGDVLDPPTLGGEVIDTMPDWAGYLDSGEDEGWCGWVLCHGCGVIKRPKACPPVVFALPFCQVCGGQALWSEYAAQIQVQASSTQKAILQKLHSLVKTLRAEGLSIQEIMPRKGPPSPQTISRFIIKKKQAGVSIKYIRSCIYHWD